VVLWNTGIPAIGQKQELLSLKTYAPLLRPQLVILAFCMNDFDDNVCPMYSFYFFENGSFVVRYARESDGSIRTLTPAEAYWRAHPLSERLSASRVVYRFFGLMRNVQQWVDSFRSSDATKTSKPSAVPESPEEYERMWGGRPTKELLREVNEYVVSAGARLLVLLIPSPKDLQAPTKRYRAVQSFCRAMGTECIEVRDLLTQEDYVMNPGPHWNDVGHRKAADVLTTRVEAILGELDARAHPPVAPHPDGGLPPEAARQNE